MRILRWIWELPQHLVGLMLTIICNVKHKETINGVKFYSGSFSGGISLGTYVIISDRSYKNNTSNIVQHEYGHTKQSLYLGPLYLIIIGLPSIIWAGLYGTIIPKTTNGYYHFYTERWADKLGNVNRWA